MFNTLKKLMAALLVISMMIPAVAISEETPILTALIDKMVYNAGEDIEFTWQVDPERADLSFGPCFFITNVPYVSEYYEYSEKFYCRNQTGGVYSMTIPSWMNGTFDAIVTCYSVDGPSALIRIEGLTINGPTEKPALNDIKFSKDLDDVKVGDTVEMVVAEGTAPLGMELWYHDTYFYKNNFSDGHFAYEYWQDADKRRCTRTFGEEALYSMTHDQMFGIYDGPDDSMWTTLSVRQINKIDLRKTQPAPTATPTVAPSTAPSTAPTNAPGAPVELNLDAITIGAKQSVDTVKVVSGFNVTWSSSNEKVATVDASGKIKGVKKGTATITATDDQGNSDSVEVTVVAKNKGVKKIKLNKKNATIRQGEKLALKATLTPADAKNKKVIWTSSNTAVATVNGKGKVKAVGVGEAVITATSSSGKIATCKLTVTGARVKKITIEGAKKMKVGDTQTLIANILPEYAANKDLKWKSSSKKIATVDENGVVTALKKGTVTITATAKDGSKVKASFTIKIKK